MELGNAEMHSEMKYVALCLLVVWVAATAGCNRTSQPSQVRIESQAKVALKQALIEARLILVDTNATISNVSVLHQLMAERPPVKALNSYGLTNLFFNSNIELWRQDIAVLPDVAIAVEVNEQKYLFVRFDWSTGSTQAPSASWLLPPDPDTYNAR